MIDNDRFTTINKIRYGIALAKELFQCLIYGLILGILLLGFALGIARKQEIFSFFANLQTVSSDLAKGSSRIPVILENTESITTKGKVSAEFILTDDRNKEVANYLDVLNFNTQLMQNGLNGVIQENLRMSRELREKLEPILLTANQTLVEGKKLIEVTTKQIDQNGNSLNELLQNGNSLVAHSEKELLETLSNINRTTAGLSVITNDANLKDLIKNSNLTMGNIEVTTRELSDLSTYYLHPLSHPSKPKGFNKYVFTPLIKVFRIINGVGSILYLVNRVQ